MLKPLLFSLALLAAAPALAQVPADAPPPPALLDDVQEDITAFKLKELKKVEFSLKPMPDSATAARLVTLRANELEIFIDSKAIGKPHSAVLKVQQKYDRAVAMLRKAQAAHTPLDLNQPQTRDLDHLLAAWLLPHGHVRSVRWQGVALTTYRGEVYGGGAAQALSPEGQIFYYFAPVDRRHGFYAYVNIPKVKKK